MSTKQTTQIFTFYDNEDQEIYEMYEVEVTKTESYTPGKYTLNNGDPGYPDEYDTHYDYDINDAPGWFNGDMLWDAIENAEKKRIF